MSRTPVQGLISVLALFFLVPPRGALPKKGGLGAARLQKRAIFWNRRALTPQLAARREAFPRLTFVSGKSRNCGLRIP